MVKRLLLIPMVMALGAGVAVTPDSDHRTRSEVAGPEQEALAEISIDTCVRACLSCDNGSVPSCAICAMCTEPALTATNC